MTDFPLEIGATVTEQGLGYEGIVTQMEPVVYVDWWKWANECYHDPIFDRSKLIVLKPALRVGDYVKVKYDITWEMLIEKVASGIPDGKKVVAQRSATARVTEVNDNGWLSVKWLDEKVAPKYHQSRWNPFWFAAVPFKCGINVSDHVVMRKNGMQLPESGQFPHGMYFHPGVAGEVRGRHFDDLGVEHLTVEIDNGGQINTVISPAHYWQKQEPFAVTSLDFFKELHPTPWYTRREGDEIEVWSEESWVFTIEPYNNADGQLTDEHQHAADWIVAAVNHEEDGVLYFDTAQQQLMREDMKILQGIILHEQLPGHVLEKLVGIVSDLDQFLGAVHVADIE